jgi:hypothetical protein
MNDATGGRPQHQWSTAVLNRLGLTRRRRAGHLVAARVMVGMQASLLLVLLVGCAMPDGRGDSQPDRGRQDLMAALPVGPPAILGAVASGVICAGMTPEMVRAAWGRPTRTASEGSGWHQRDTWHYAGRPHHADLMGGQTSGVQPLREWTVSFGFCRKVAFSRVLASVSH